MKNWKARVFIVNLAKYNNGEDSGFWFNLPNYDEDDLLTKIKKKLGDGEYAIHDYKNIPIKVSENEDVEKINEFVEFMEEKEYDDDVIQQLVDGYSSDPFNTINYINRDVQVVENISDYGELARHLHDEKELWLEIPEYLENYIDWDSIGDTLETSTQWVITSTNKAVLID